jgi:hypothetical protein
MSCNTLARNRDSGLSKAPSISLSVALGCRSRHSRIPLNNSLLNACHSPSKPALAIISPLASPLYPLAPHVSILPPLAILPTLQNFDAHPAGSGERATTYSGRGLLSRLESLVPVGPDMFGKPVRSGVEPAIATAAGRTAPALRPSAMPLALPTSVKTSRPATRVAGRLRWSPVLELPNRPYPPAQARAQGGTQSCPKPPNRDRAIEMTTSRAANAVRT